MSVSEFMDWQEYYAQEPFDDLHRFYRPAAMLAGVGGAKSDEALEWLLNQKQQPINDVDASIYAAFGVKKR